MSSVNDINNTAAQTVILHGPQSRPVQGAKAQNIDTGTTAGLDKTELSEIGKELSKTSRKSLDTDALDTSLNTDASVGISQGKTDDMIQETLEQPPQKTGRTDGQQISSTYLTNSGKDELSRLQQILSKLAEDLFVGNDETPST